jgi:cell division protein FtsA
MAQELFTGLDIGSNSIRVAVGQFMNNGQDRPVLQIIGAAECPSSGINKGIITSIEDAVSSLSTCLDQAERLVGQPLSSAWVSLAGSGVLLQLGKGVIAVSNPEGEIQYEDVDRVLESAKMVSTPLNYETLHILPRNFLVDGQGGIKDPVGMSGMRLEVETQIVQCSSTLSKNLRKCVYRTSLEIEGLVLSSLAAAEATLNHKQQNLGVALLDIGANSTNLLVFEEGNIILSSTIPLGANHITSDIAIVLRTSIDTAEEVKLKYGYAMPTEVRDEDLDLSQISDDQTTVSRKFVSEIINARLQEIFKRVDKELKKINRSGLLPAGVVLVGGGAKLPGILEVAKDTLRLPAILGYPQNVVSAVDKVNDVSFATAVGLVMWGSRWGNGQSDRSGKSKEVLGKMKKWFKNLLP